MSNDNFVVIQGWMCNELGLKGNDLLVYALIYGFSQDGESEFSGGRNYIAKTFNISLPTVDKALKNLIDKHLIEKISMDINNVTFNKYKITLGVVKKLYGGSKETLPNNIINNINENDIISKDIISSEQAPEFNFGKSSPKKPNLYQNCISLINDWTDLPEIRTLLLQYLDLCMEMKCIRGANQWKGMLKTLEKVQEQCHPHTFEEIIEQSINRGYKTFYPINDYRTTKAPDSVKSIKMTAEEKEELYRLAEEREQNGQVGYY